MAADVEQRGRNPDWSRDETILLLDLYFRAPGASSGHPEVLELSQLLNRAARADGKDPLPTFRNPAGVAMRLRNIARKDPAAPPHAGGLREGGAMDGLVWAEFGNDRAALQAAAALVRRRWSDGSGRGQDEPRSSRGPLPSFGMRTSSIEDGANFVYVMRLAGGVVALLPHRGSEGGELFKVGRSNDVARRVAELMAGFPPGSAVRYETLRIVECVDAWEAHRRERALLDLCDRNGWSLGGEFALAPEPEFLAAANALSP